MSLELLTNTGKIKQQRMKVSQETGLKQGIFGFQTG